MHNRAASFLNKRMAQQGKPTAMAQQGKPTALQILLMGGEGGVNERGANTCAKMARGFDLCFVGSKQGTQERAQHVGNLRTSRPPHGEEVHVLFIWTRETRKQPRQECCATQPDPSHEKEDTHPLITSTKTCSIQQNVRRRMLGYSQRQVQ